MPTTVAEQVTAVEDQVLDLIRQGQDTTLSVVREITGAITSALPKVPEWVDAFTASLPKFPDWAQSYLPEVPDQVTLPSIDNLVDFSEKVWDSQRQFNQKLIDTIAPVANQAMAAARETAKAARGAVAATTDPVRETKASHRGHKNHEAVEETAKAAVDGNTRPAANRRTRAVNPEA